MPDADVGMPSKELERKYRKHRSRLLFTPFRRVEARRIWGAESPIELFLDRGTCAARAVPAAPNLDHGGWGSLSVLVPSLEGS